MKACDDTRVLVLAFKHKDETLKPSLVARAVESAAAFQRTIASTHMMYALDETPALHSEILRAMCAALSH